MSIKSRNRTPKVIEKYKKHKGKCSVSSSDSTHGSENTMTKSSATDDGQSEPKSILNLSKQAKVIQLDDKQKYDYIDNKNG